MSGVIKWSLQPLLLISVVGGVLLVWPDGPAYREFRDQHTLFNVYVAFIQYLQYVYQKGCLYRLRSLGERREMDITIDGWTKVQLQTVNIAVFLLSGFHSWMWKGLSFLLPFLYLGYLMQLYNAWTLYQEQSREQLDDFLRLTPPQEFSTYN